MLSRWSYASTIAMAYTLALTAPPAVGCDDETPSAGSRIDIGGIDQAGGTLKGTVKFDGKPKLDKKLKVDADPFCHKAHKDAPLRKERYVFGKNNTLQNVFVYVSKGLEGQEFSAPTTPAILDQSGCAYMPHVSGVVVDQPLEIRNGDDTLHNVKLNSKNNGKENKAMPAGSKPLTKTFKKPEIAAEYQCDVHSWMGAYIHVMEHPFFAVTQDDGTFEIRGLPPGEYEVSVWHEFSKYFKPDKPSVTVQVDDGQTVDIPFTYAPKPKKKKKKK